MENDVLLLIPAYNEEGNITNVLRDLQSICPDVDILVVNDGSKDRTLEEASKFDVQIVSHLVNLGYGAALQTGFQYAAKSRYEYIVQFDADGQHDPKYLKSIVDTIKSQNCDIVIGSRFLGESAYKADAAKLFVIRAMRFLIKALTGARVTDPTSGFKALSRRTFHYYAQTGNFPTDYPDANILIKMLRKKYRVAEVPVNIRPRISGETMHSGLKPIFYVFNVLISIAVILLNETFEREN